MTQRRGGKGAFRFDSPCEVCRLRPECTEPCWMVQRLMGHEETPKISKARIYGYYFSSLGLNRRQLRRHYKALTPRQREVAAMYYFEERTVEEVATALGVTKGAVSRCLSRARRRMALQGE